MSKWIRSIGRGSVWPRGWVLFHDSGTGRRWVVSSTPLAHFTHEKGPVSIVQEAGWVPGPVWTGGKSRPHRDSIPDRPAHSQSLWIMTGGKRNTPRESISALIIRSNTMLWTLCILVFTTTCFGPYQIESQQHKRKRILRLRLVRSVHSVVSIC